MRTVELRRKSELVGERERGRGAVEEVRNVVRN
jgi:hypothetical protein